MTPEQHLAEALAEKHKILVEALENRHLVACGTALERQYFNSICEAAAKLLKLMDDPPQHEAVFVDEGLAKAHEQGFSTCRSQIAKIIGVEG